MKREKDKKFIFSEKNNIRIWKLKNKYKEKWRIFWKNKLWLSNYYYKKRMFKVKKYSI